MTPQKMVEEWREKDPAMFSHPELHPGEVYIGSILVDVVEIQLGIYRGKGLASVRKGNGYLRELKDHPGHKVIYFPLFANAVELAWLVIAYKGESPQANK